jgi:hypothetical protein
VAKKVRAPAASGNRARGSKRGAKGMPTAAPRRRKVARVEPEGAPAAQPSTPEGRPDPHDHTPMEGIAIADLLRVDRNFADAVAVERFRGRYPVPGSRALARSHKPTIADLKLAREVVEIVGVAVVLGEEDQWKRVREAHGILRAIETQPLRIAGCVRAVASFVDLHHRRDPRTLNLPHGLIRELAFYEPAYQRLDAALVGEGLEQTKPEGTARKGGRGNAGPLALAAKLTLDAGAFGYEQKADEPYEKACLRVKRALDGAVRRAGQAKLPRGP